MATGLFLNVHVAAMAAGDIAHDGEAKARARSIEVACLVQPEEWLEHILAGDFRNTRTVIVEGHDDGAWRLADIDVEIAGVTPRIFGQIGDEA